MYFPKSKGIKLSDLSDFIVDVDKTKTAEKWDEITKRIDKLFLKIIEKAESSGFSTIVIVSHGLTIGTFLWLINSSYSFSDIPSNAEIILVRYTKGSYQLLRRIVCSSLG